MVTPGVLRRLTNAAQAWKPERACPASRSQCQLCTGLSSVAAGMSCGEVMAALESDGEVEPPAPTSRVIVGSGAAASVWVF